MQNLAKFKELPLTSLKPNGWLRGYLEHQRDGLTGHIEAAGFPYNTNGWMVPEYDIAERHAWWPYEQTAYWIDGALRCGYLLQDENLIARAAAQIEYVLTHPDGDGYLGPAFMKTPSMFNRWPHSILFRAVTAYAEANGQPEIYNILARHYLSGSSPHSGWREVCNIETILAVYEKTGNSRLLDIANAAFTEYNQRYPESDASLANLLSDRKATEHGVTFNETAKLGAILHSYTGNESYLQASINAYRKLDRDQVLVDGVCSSTEGLKGKDPLDSHETCDIADYTWSCGHLLMATGNAEYADKIERACLNAAPGAVTADFKAMQYFSCPNQVIATTTSNHNLFYRGFDWMSYQPDPTVQCCVGDVNRILPNYASRMWMSDRNNGLAAVFYGPSQVTARLGSTAQEVTIFEETAYPFSDEIIFTIKTREPVEFPFTLRIPGWCQSAQLLINGEPIDSHFTPGNFITLQQTFSDGDHLRLELPMLIKTMRWPRGGISIERGPLVYSLKIEEIWSEVNEETHHLPAFPALNLYTASLWNYALDLDENDPAQDIEVVEHEYSNDPWRIDTAPLELRVPARRVLRWQLSKRKSFPSEHMGPQGHRRYHHTGNFVFTPQIPSTRTLHHRLGKRLERISLIPYGCTKLRITIFPYAR
jgi:DUF1680 family protein